MRNVYIVLTQTGTFFSRMIRFYTKDPYNHASISFVTDLEVMYSFGRKRRYNLLRNGFITENFHRGVFAYFPRARCCVMEIPVENEEFIRMKERVEAFCCDGDRYRFNIIGVVGQMFGADIGRENHYFCSQFVSYIMGCAECWNKDPLLTKPMDLYYIPGKKVIYEGMICHYGPADPYLLQRETAV